MVNVYIYVNLTSVKWTWTRFLFLAPSLSFRGHGLIQKLLNQALILRASEYGFPRRWNFPGGALFNLRNSQMEAGGNSLEVIAKSTFKVGLAQKRRVLLAKGSPPPFLKGAEGDYITF
jgi:hypothetical protein